MYEVGLMAVMDASTRKKNRKAVWRLRGEKTGEDEMLVCALMLLSE